MTKIEQDVRGAKRVQCGDARCVDGVIQEGSGLNDVEQCEQCLEHICSSCDGTGWFSPTPMYDDGWECCGCNGKGFRDDK